MSSLELAPGGESLSLQGLKLTLRGLGITYLWLVGNGGMGVFPLTKGRKKGLRGLVGFRVAGLRAVGLKLTLKSSRTRNSEDDPERF